ncbi:hypothetical protein OIDMADRAFT_198449 [Oidiodendron maius Zn]|uniref:DUF747-domain-containing protein n=1 Tax=Oidiodendron maius (strain Zn) TaxID=913774 RepID=A0A0C3GYY8_OIDMZ|nr:hypothetical protein OIDMADRAFT_198449 [Oidiodendron maius Zn]
MHSQPSTASKSRRSRDYHDVSEENIRKPTALIIPKSNREDKVFKLTAAEMEELTSAPDSLPRSSLISPGLLGSRPPPLAPSPLLETKSHYRADEDKVDSRTQSNIDSLYIATGINADQRPAGESTPLSGISRRPGLSSRRISSPQASRNRGALYTKDTYLHTSPKRRSGLSGPRPEPLDLAQSKPSSGAKKPALLEHPPSPIPQSIPLPPMSIPTYLQLEISSSKPSPLYIYRSSTSDDVYESSKIKFERLLNFLLLPPQLEQILYFGTLACLDAWLYTFTILPLRFLKAAAILIQWWGQTLDKEIRFIAGFIYHGSGRMWHRQRGRLSNNKTPLRSQSVPRTRRPQVSTPLNHPQSARTPDHSNGNAAIDSMKVETERKSRPEWGRRHRRVKSQPSSLLSSHKADLLQGAVIICSCIILMKLDASRMYHSIRGQAAIKLYVIYNVLEVCDKLFAALGQDIFECLFSNETLERDVDGRSKILRPFGMFILALVYNVIHAAALLYQVITLNVAVNSYSNALLTLLMSNQFVEIKSSVFKKIEKDNLFQLTCADVVERFQLWLMLMIIALRNIVEVGGLSILSSSGTGPESLKETIPTRSYSMLPNSFTILPNWTGEVLSPFLLVLGSEMLVDWIKHAYINKFNNVKPAIYQRYLDVLAKDYYTNAFVNQNLIKRLGLPVIPLSCLFIRSSFQTYNMFLATHLPPPIPSAATDLAVESATASPATMAAFEHFDTIIRKALGRAAYGIPDPTASNRWYIPSADDVIAAITMLVFFLGAFFVLLACKLVLGMLLLRFARNRYRSMKIREHASYDTGGRRLGGWGVVEMDEAKRRWFYDDDPDALKKLREKEKAAKERQENNGGAGQDFGKISRYEMVKRIW